MPETHEHVYFVQGMHCPACELTIERRLLELKGIRAADASVRKGQVLIEYEGKRPGVVALNRLFAQDGYIFSERPFEASAGTRAKDAAITIGIALLVIAGFIALEKSGLSALLNVNATTSLPAFFLFGLLAGVSSCAALTGGLILSMSKQWAQTSSSEGAPARFEPHILFNVGRLASYGLLGALLGALGSRLQLSPGFAFAVVVAVSLLMGLLGLQMLGVRGSRGLSISLPKTVTRYIARGEGPGGRFVPLIIGTLTFFLPCGFTITAQGVALLSANALLGGAIMFLFALGTAPGLLAIGLSSATLLRNPRLSAQFSRVAGIVVLFFALSNINAQFNALGLPSLSDISLARPSIASAVADDLPSIVQGKQILTMEASAFGYRPKYLKVRVGIPVRWEIKDVGTSGCTNAIISELFEGQIDLTPGKTSVREFTPRRPGKFKFSCWMGMVTGTIEVVDKF